MIRFEHFETANDIMIRFSGVSIRECKIVCVNLKEELKKGKPSPYD